MFNTFLPQIRLSGRLYLAERIYHASIRKVREEHGNAGISILIVLGQTAMFTLAFYVILQFFQFAP